VITHVSFLCNCLMMITFAMFQAGESVAKGRSCLDQSPVATADLCVSRPHSSASAATTVRKAHTNSFISK
jgi:hypothetical protein